VATFFYTASGASGDVDAYLLDPAAETVTRVATARAGGNLSSIAASRLHRRLYVADRTRPGIVTFEIDAAGSLSEIARVPTDSQLVYLCLSADERSLYGASYRDGSVAAYPVDDDGIAWPAAGPSLSLGADAHCHAIAEGPDGTLWVSALGHDLLYQVGHDPETAALTQFPSPLRATAGSGPRHLGMHPGRSELYVIGERSARIAAYPLGPGGIRREWDTIPDGIRLAPGIVREPDREHPTHDAATGLPYTWAADLALSPDGSLAFSSERSSSTVSVTSTETGELLGWTRTEEQPRGITLDPAGEFLLVTGERSATVSLYRVEDGGRALRLAHRAPARAGVLWAEAV
jgi:6-phosphogluconolactonase